MFSEVKDTVIDLRDDKIEIIHLNNQNQDPAIIELSETKFGYTISYWDGYSLSETEESADIMKTLKVFKRYAKKMAKNLKKFSDHI